MNLANDNEPIIPGTTGIITGAASQANLYASKIKEGASADTKNKMIVVYLGVLWKAHRVLQGRIDGTPLKELVPPSRVVNNQNRGKEEQQSSKEERKPNYVADRADWFWK